MTGHPKVLHRADALLLSPSPQSVLSGCASFPRAVASGGGSDLSPVFLCRQGGVTNPS